MAFSAIRAPHDPHSIRIPLPRRMLGRGRLDSILTRPGMLPLQDVLPSRRTPRLTLGFIALSALVYVYEVTLSTPALRSLMLTHGLVPAQAWWRPILTSLFLSAGPLQAILNLHALWIFGDNVEDRLGGVRYVLLFLLAGVLSALAGIGLDPSARTPLLGPAGAVAGVLGAHLALMPPSRILVLVPSWRNINLMEIPALLVMGFWLLFQTMGQFADGTSRTTAKATIVMPLVGFAVGAAAAFLLKRPERMRVDYWSPRPEPRR
jgi:membrane associated rhomboid family serine protease